jgi:hypothetical protein
MNPTQALIALSESPKSDFGKVDFASQSHPQKVFSAVFGSSGAIMMGGFDGYFRNADGETADFVVEAYRAIGLAKRAEIIERACRLLSQGRIPGDSDRRCELVDSLSSESIEQLEALSDEFMRFPEQIDPSLLDFVATHPEIFGKVG